ncbi:MAG: ABC transporter ATP-binding protein/permease [Patescibacteria group bacterium]|nr:ABC transporter ATP-binding protein/permease [Patescibacteria group bacterium]
MIRNKLPVQKISQIRETAHTSWQLLKLIWKIDRWLFLGTAASTTIPAFIPFINIYIYKLVIDLVVTAIKNGNFDISQFYPLFALRVATYFLQEVSFRTQDFIGRVLWSKVPNIISQLILTKISTLDIQYYENSKFRDLLDKARESYNFRPQQLIDHLFYGLQSIIQVTIAFGAIAKLNWFLVILVSLVAIPEFINRTQLSKLSWGIWSQNSPLRKRYGYLEHVLQGPREVKEVRMFGLAKRFIGEIKEIQNKFYKDNVGIAKRNYFLNLIFNGLSTGVFVGVEIYVILQALAKRVTIGDINFYTGVVNNFQNGLGGVFRNVSGVFEDSLYVKSIFEVLELQSIVKTAEDPVKVDLQKAPSIEFRDVDFRYPESDHYILKDFSLSLNPGDKVAFVGENGAGKSTIIKLLARFYDTEKGEILINGVNIKDLDLDEWYRHLGVLFQDFNKYDHTVRENIEFGRVHEKSDLDQVIKAATSAGAHPMIQELDKGYDQMLGKTFDEGIELSGGQWQKIALSRAFFRNAPVLVLDEPTASIDAKAESEIFSRVEKLSKDKTVIIISHRFSTVRNADKIYVIDNGKIVESGDHHQLMKLDGQYASLFNLQAKGYQ